MFIVIVNRSKMVRIYEYSALKTLPFDCNEVCNFFSYIFENINFIVYKILVVYIVVDQNETMSISLILEAKEKYNMTNTY